MRYVKWRKTKHIEIEERGRKGRRGMKRKRGTERRQNEHENAHVLSPGKEVKGFLKREGISS